jgi:endonuclease III
MTTSDSTATSTKSLLDQMKSSFLQNQYSFMTSLLYPDNSTSSDSSDSLTSILENVEADKTNNVIANNPQLAQLFNALNLSSSSSGSSDLTTSLLQSLDSKGLSESNSASIKTAMENLLKSYGSDINSSTQEILNKYLSLSYDKPPQIKTIV